MLRLLDLYCGAGGCAKGYKDAGFHVTGVDHTDQPRYAGDVFVLADALDYLAEHYSEYDVVHASPPCQHYSEITALEHRKLHPDLIAPTRLALQVTGLPYVIENVENARCHLISPIKLCGSMFGLHVFRHRYFEINPNVMRLTPPCKHNFDPVLITGTTCRRNEKGKRIEYTVQERRDACGIDWMTSRELDEAVPPVYCAWIGEHLLSIL